MNFPTCDLGDGFLYTALLSNQDINNGVWAWEGLTQQICVDVNGIWNPGQSSIPTATPLSFPSDTLAPDGLLSSFQIADTLALENILAIGLVVLCFGIGFMAGNTR